eukprot:TRINITY_DN8389_c0_g4_i2.p2 TRINITY_DN8389_c0_g4~~TRINITY_DN8389_c0_g4_i2.p2  ORF type:complete len:135 (+),score=17.05 TRINITY_DN8389_c0_g4_i2:337-741(+)
MPQPVYISPHPTPFVPYSPYTAPPNGLSPAPLSHSDTFIPVSSPPEPGAHVVDIENSHQYGGGPAPIPSHLIVAPAPAAPQTQLPSSPTAPTQPPSQTQQAAAALEQELQKAASDLNQQVQGLVGQLNAQFKLF